MFRKRRFSDDNINLSTSAAEATRDVSPVPLLAGRTSHHQEHRVTRMPRRQTMYQAWKWELLASLLFLATLGAIVGTIYPHQGKPLPQWPFRISVNTLLAVYSVTLKATMIFVVASCIAHLQWSWLSVDRPLVDLARFSDISHGDILGAFRWLFTNNIRQPLIAFGAAIIIVSFATEPFVQQLTSYINCSTSVRALDGKLGPTLPRTNYVYPEDNDVTIPGAGNPELPQAIMAGLVGSPNPLAATGCSTGNCTFNTPYTTAAICIQCDDISDNVTVTKTCLDRDKSIVDCATASFNQSVVWANYTSSLAPMDNLTWSPLYDNSSLFEVETILHPQWPNFVMLSFGLLWGQNSFSEAKVDDITLEPKTDCDDPETNNAWSCKGYGGAVCDMRFCARTYNASIEAGVLVEELLEESPKNVTPAPSPGNDSTIPALLDMKCLDDNQVFQLEKLGYNITLSSPRWAAYNLDDDFLKELRSPGQVASLSTTLLDHGCLYIMDLMFQENWFYIGSAVDGVVQTYGYTRAAGSDTIEMKPLDLLFGTGGPMGLFNNSRVDLATISARFDGVSEQLTTLVRQTGNRNHSTPALGVPYHYATCLNVNWPWFSLPATLVLCTLVLFAATVWVKSQDGTPMWKANVLALIFHGPGGASWHGVSNFINEEALYLNTLEGMEKRAREVVVRLDQESTALVQLIKVASPEVARQRRSDSNFSRLSPVPPL